MHLQDIEHGRYQEVLHLERALDWSKGQLTLISKRLCDSDDLRPGSGTTLFMMLDSSNLGIKLRLVLLTASCVV
jgi:hypothetical protein